MSNECYKGCTWKRSLNGMQKTSSSAEDPPSSSSWHHKIAIRHFHIIPLCHLVILLLNMWLIYQKICVICSKASHKIECMKCSISEKGRAEKFLKASLSLVLLDNIYTRHLICSIQVLYLVKTCITIKNAYATILERV